MPEIKLFENPQFGSVRFIPENDSFFVVGKDVLRALGYAENSLSQLNNVFASVPEEWKGHKPIMTPGGTQQMLCLSEQGLYFFLGRSDKPAALSYQKWVAGEVVPSIRKTGAYLQTPQSYLEALEQCVALEKARLAAEAAKQQAQIECAQTQAQLSLTTDAYEAQKEQLGQVAVAAVGLMEQLGLAGGYTKCAAVKGLSAFFSQASSTKFLAALGNYMRDLSKELGVDRKRVPDPVWKQVWAYSDTAWEEFFDRCNNLKINSNTAYIGSYWKD